MIKLFTHNDLDGIGCEIVAKNYYHQDNVDVVICDHDNVNELFRTFVESKEYLNYKKVFMTDISISKDNADLIVRHGFNFVLLDHHKTAEFLNEYDFAIIKTEDECGKKESGASLLYKYLHAVYHDTFEDFYVELTRLYDTWEWKELNAERAKDICTLFSFFGREKWVSRVLYAMEHNSECFFEEYEEILIALKSKAQRYIERKNSELKIFEKDGYKIGYVCAEQEVSELGNYICLNNDVDFVMINMNNKDMSLRATKDIDLSVIAKLNGGGGHPKASGFPMLSTDIAQNMVNKLIIKQ